MSDLKDRFEREMQGLPISTHGFERTLARVRRRDRNRRLVAGFVALVLVGASVLFLVRTWGSSPIPADQPPRPTPAALGSLAYGINGDIYVAESDGSNAVRIADGRPPTDCGVQDGFSTGEYWTEGSLWSPDGRYLAYRRANCQVAGDFRWHVVISDPQGNVVSEFPGEGWDIGWSPDSTRVAVWVELFETIGVFGLDGERQALLTVAHTGGDHDPMWLPDGESLAVNEVVIPIDGSRTHNLPLLADGYGGPRTYSPDGSRVAYPVNKSLVVAEADGSNPQVVFDDWVWGPVWSPAGNRIAFTQGGRRGRPHQIHVLDLATGTVTLAAEAPLSRRGDIEVIDFSPEGDRILFSTYEGDVKSLWSVNADGSHLRRLVAGLGIDAGGDWWSPGQTD